MHEESDYYLVVVRKTGFKVYSTKKCEFVTGVFIYMSEAQERADELNLEMAKKAQG